MTETLILNLKPRSQVYIYGLLANEPFILKKPMVTLQRISISNYLVFDWYESISTEEKNLIKSKLLSMLKN